MGRENDMTEVNFDSTNSTQNEALDQLVSQDKVQAEALDGGDSETLERQVYQQIGGVAEGGTAAEIAAKKEQELRQLVGQPRRGIDKDGDGTVDSGVEFSEGKRFLKRPRVLITEYAISGDSTALQAQWVADKDDPNGFGAIPTSGAATGGPAPVSGASPEPAEPSGNLALLEKDIPTIFQKDGEDTPYIVEKDGKLAFNEGADHAQAVEAAALQVITDAGYTKDTARAYLEDVRQKAGGDSDRMLDQINADRKQFGDYSASSLRDRGGAEKPLSMYANPKTYARHRAEGADKDDLDSFDSGYSEEGIAGLSGQEEWARVMGAPGVNGGDYLDQLYGGAGGGKFTRRDIGEIAGDGVYTSDRAKEVGELATQYRKEEFDRIDEEIRGQQEIIDHADSTDEQEQAAKVARKRLETEKAGVDRKIQDAVRNPQEFQRLVGKDKFQASKHERSVAAKARETGEETLLSQVEKGFGKVVKTAGDLKSLAVDTVLGAITGVDTFFKRNDQFRTTQDGLYGEDREAALTRQDEQRERRGEIFNTQNEGLAERRDEHHTRAMEASTETGVGAGSRVGTDPEANAVADNMMASANDVEQPGPDGKNKSRRTENTEDLAQYIRAQRAIDRYMG